MARPWETWQLNDDFFSALSQWTIDHPQSRFDLVLDGICTAIDNGKDIAKIIPDTPFPARSLVQALCQLIKLGKEISKAKGDVQAFAKEIIHWVSKVVSEFNNSNGGRFTEATWKHLESMRDLIDQICVWATKRLNEKGCRRLWHGRSIGKEIDKYKSQFAAATQIFIQLSMINQAKANDAILETTEPLVPAIASIRNMATSQKLIDGLTAILKPRIAANCTYVYQDKPLCAPGTRSDILEKITKWAEDTSDHSPRLLWLTGVPGVGKSSIATSISTKFKDEKSLWAQFFISRSYAGTTKPSLIFPSIALQLAESHHEAALAIHDTLEKQSSLVDYITDLQATKLFVEPIKVLSELNHSQPIVVVIDGLDEIDGDLNSTVGIISRAITSLPRNAKIFISSRSGNDIQKCFSPMVKSHDAQQIDLDTSDPSLIYDVGMVFRDQIKKIVNENNLGEEWPGRERMQFLCDKASGLFIWAVIAITYIRNRFFFDGRECLDEVLDDLSVQGMEGINALYQTILDRNCRRKEDHWAFERFRRIMGCIIVLQEPLTLASIQCLLNLRKREKGPPADIAHFVGQFRTILVVGTDDINNSTVPRLHKSFVEFITNDCDARFRVDVDASNAELALQCLHQLNTLTRDICDIEHFAQFNVDIPDLSSRIDGRLSAHLRYACRFWAIHLSEKAVKDATVQHLFQTFFYQKFLHWIEVMSLLDYNSVSSVLERASNWAQITYNDDNDLIDLIDDARRFVQMFSEPISKSAAHTYISALPFTPSSSRIYQHYHTGTGCAVDVLTGALKYWPQHIWQSGEHAHWVVSVAFSPDGKRIVSGTGSEYESIYIWDTMSGQLIGSPLKCGGKVKSVALSPDGKMIVSGSWDGTIRFCDSGSGQPVSPPIRGHTGAALVAFSHDGRVVSSSDDGIFCIWYPPIRKAAQVWYGVHTKGVTSVAFSPNGKQVLSGSADHTICVWDAATGKHVRSLRGHTEEVGSVAFSPDGKQILSGSFDGTTRLWDTASGQLITTLGNHSWITSVAFSPDGKQIVSGNFDRTIDIWDSASGQLVGSLEGHVDMVTSVAFSPTGKQIVSGSQDRTLCLWDATRSSQLGRLPPNGHTEWVRSIAFSPDGKQIVSGSDDKTIRLWDAVNGQLIGSFLGGQTSDVTSIAFSPDGKQIVASSDNVIRIWNAASGQLTRSLLDGDASRITSVAFSPDGKQVVSGSHDHTIRLWDAASGQLVGSPLMGHKDEVISAAFSPDGKQIVSRSDDGTICLWDAASGQLVGSFVKALIGYKATVAFSPDGTKIVTRSNNGVVQHFSISGQQIQRQESFRGSQIFTPLIENGWVRSTDGSLLYWFPTTRHLHYGTWSSNGAKLVLGSSSGLVTIIDATRVFQKRGILV